jgi:hypothetical protein
MINRGRLLPKGYGLALSARASFWPVALLALMLALPVTPAEAQPAFSPSDLAGTWRIHILTGSGVTDVPGSTLRGTLELDATGALVAGTLGHADGSSTTLTGGAFAITPLGVVVASLSATGVSDAEIGDARMLVDRRVILGVISGGDLGDIAGVDFGLVTLIKITAGFADDLVATWRYHELRTPDTLGQPPVSVVGELVFDAAAITDGALIQSDGPNGTPTGTHAAAADGSFTASVSGVDAPWQLTGQVASSADLIAGTTNVGAAAAFGLALASRVDPGVTLATSDLAGAWRIYAVALDGTQGNVGTFLRGALVVNAGGVLVSGSIADDPADVTRTLASGLLAVDGTTGRVTGSVSATTGQTFTLDGTLRGSRDLVSGVLTVGGTAPAALGLVVMVRNVSLVAFDVSAYSVAEGSPAQVTIVRTGDTTQAATLNLRGQGDRFGNQVFAVNFAAGAASRTIGIPTADDAIIGAEPVTLSLEDLPANVLLGGGATATLTLLDNEQPGTFRFGAATLSVVEGSTAPVTVVRSGTRLGGGVTVGWEVTGGTATRGVDYDLPLSGTLTFGPGVASQPLPVPTVKDTLAEGPETIVLTLRDPSTGATLGLPSTITITITDDDVAGTIQFGPGPFRASENAVTAAITVTRTGGGASGVTVDYETSDGTGRVGVDYTATSGTLTFDAGVTALTFTVPLIDNAAADGDRTVRLALRNPGGRAVLGALKDAVLTILDDEVGVRFDATAYSVAENLTSGATITVIRTGPTTGVSSVTYSTSDGTAQAGADYTPASGRLVFQIGEKSKTFKVPILEDSLVEGPETVLLVLSNPSGAILGPVPSAVLTIVDNDLGGTLQFAAPALSVQETQAFASIVVSRIGGVASAVTVDYVTSDGTAQAGQDYGETTGTLTFGVGDRTKTILVPLLSDRLVEGNETFVVTLSNPTGGATLGTPTQTVVTVADDDNGGVIKFSSATYRVQEPLDTPSTLVTITVQRTGTNLASGVSVQFATSDGTAQAGPDYVAAAGQLVFGPGETQKTFQITVKGDALLEADETVTLTLSNPQGGATLGTPSTAVLTIVDTTPSVQFDRPEYVVEERVGIATLTVMRSGPDTGTATVRYTTTDIPVDEPPAGHALAGSDYRAASGVLTFRPGDRSKTIPVTILVDPAAEDTESFRVVLSDPVGLSLGANNPALVTILDNARPGVVQFASTATSVREGTAAVITVTRTGGTDGTVTVGWSATGGTAAAGADYNPSSGTLTFTAGVTSRTITIATLNDTIAELDETVTLELGNVTGTAALGASTVHTLTIQDNDVAGTIELSADTYTVTEGASAVITVRRTGAASAVTVRFATEPLAAGPGAATEGADYTAVNSILTFGAGEMIKTFTVPTTLDTEAEQDESFRVTLSDPQPTGLAALGARTTATVTILDRQPRVAFRDAITRVTEGQLATVTVTRTPPLTGRVTVSFAVTAGTAAEGTDYAPAGGVLTFEPGAATARFTVATLANGAIDGTRSAGLTLSGPVGASLGLATAELRIEDDERPGTVQFSQTAYNVIEGDTAELVVTRTGGADGVVSVQYAVTGGSATGGGVDYTLNAGTITFEAGRTSVSLAVPTMADGLPEGTETVVVQLSNVTGGATLGAPATTTLFIVDREQTAAFASDTFTVGETESQATITVVRRGLPTGTLSVTARTSGGTAIPDVDYVPVTLPLTFAAGEIVKTVPVVIPPGAAAGAGNRTVGLVLEGDPGALSVPSTATLTILDFRPDLVVVSVSPPSNALSGKILSAPLSVRNVGRVMAPPFQVGIFLSRDDGTDAAKQAGAGTLLRLETVKALVPGESMQFPTSLDLADDLPSGAYFVSAIADFSQAVGEIDEGNNGLASAPKKIQVSRSLGKLSAASATLSQGDAVAATSVLGVARPAAVDGCDAVGTIALTGSFRITAQIGGTATAMASLTGTLNDQPVQYEFMFNTLTIADDNTVTGGFDITSISGAFSGNGTGVFTGSLVDRALEGGVSGVVNTSTPRICNFVGTLRAAGDTSFILGLEQRARGGVFADAATPTLELPVAVTEYLAAFGVLFDGSVPSPSVVTFTGPAGSGLTNTPASGRRSEFDAEGAGATYVSPLIARAGGGPGGDFSILYKGAPRVLNVPEPGTDRRLVLAVPTIDVDPTGVLTAVSLTWKDRTGVSIDPPAFVGRVQVSLESNAGLSPLYVSPPMPRGNTSHTLALPVLWEDAAELAVLYQDTVTGHEYRVAYPKARRAVVELAREHTVDKTGVTDGQFLTLSLVVPAGVVDIDTPGAVLADGEPVPFFGRTLEGDQPVDVFRLRRDVAGTAPAPGTPVVFTVTPITPPLQVLLASVRNASTNQSIQFTNLTGILEADAMLGVRRLVSWTLPPPAAAGGFDIDGVELSGTVRAPDGLGMCAANADRELGPDATSGFITLPPTCFGQPVDSAQICILARGVNGEAAKACHTFGPDDMVVDLGKAAFATENGVATVTVTRRGPTRKPAAVRYSTVDGSAIASVDYVPRSEVLTFPPGVTKQAFTITTLDNTLAQGRKDLTIHLSDPSPGLLIGVNDRPVIIDDDDDGGAIQFAQATYSVTEGGTGILTITRTGLRLASNVSVDYQVVGGTATLGIDFTLPPGTLTFAANQASQTIPVSTIADNLAEGPRTVIVRLSNPRGGSRLDARSETTLTIGDDEQGGVIAFATTAVKLTEAARLVNLTVTRTGKNLGGNVTVDFRASPKSTAVAGVDFAPLAGTLTFGPGQTTATVPVTLLDDAQADRLKVLIVELFNPRGGNASLGVAIATISVEDNEQEIQFSASTFQVGEGKSLLLTVTRTGPTTGTATVRWTTVNGTAVGGAVGSGADYLATSGTLTFQPGSTSQLLLISTLQDSAGENDETFFVDLSLPTPSTAVLGPRNRATITILDDEQTVRFASSSIVVTEGGVATVTVQRNGPTNTTTRVTYTVTNGTGVAGTDYLAAASGALTFNPGVTSVSFPITTLNTLTADGTRTVNLTLTGAAVTTFPPTPVFITRSTSTLFILNDEQGGVIQFSPTAVSFSEKQPVIIKGLAPGFTVTRTGTNLASGVTVNYQVLGGTAISGTHYTIPGGTSGTLTFAAGQTSLRIPVTIIDNALADHDRTILIGLSNAQGGGSLGAATQATMTIVDDEQEIQFSASAYAVSEGSATITVVRGGPTIGTATVNFATVAGGTATLGPDYKPVSGTLTFAAGVTSASFIVPVASDTLAELNETVLLQLSAPGPSGVVLGPRATATLIIVNNDAGGVIQFTASGVSVTEGGDVTLTLQRTGTNLGGGVTVGYQVTGGTAVSGTDFIALPPGTLTFAAGETSKTISLTTINNTVVNPTRTIAVSLVSPQPAGVATLGTPAQTTISILNDDEGGVLQFSPTTASFSEKTVVIGRFIFPAFLNVARTGTNLASGVTVSYQVIGGTAINGTDYSLAPGTLTFGEGQTSARITIPPIDDALAEGDRTVVVQIFNPQGGASVLSTASVGTLTIVDNEQAVQFSLSSYTVTEGGVATISVTRTGPTDAVATVQYATVAGGAAGGGTATAGSDYLPVSGTLTFDVGKTVASFTVTTIQDAVFESNETVILQLSNPAPAGVLLGSRSQATLVIANDDQRVRFSAAGFSVAEGNVGQMVVVREGPPNGTITVRYAVIGGSASQGPDYKLPDGTLTFGPGVTSQIISVPTARDLIFESTETVIVRLSAPTPGVTLGTPLDATLSITNSGLF